MGRLSNLMIVPNGIDPYVFRPAGHPPAGRSTIVAVTRFERRRGGELLPEIVKSVCQAEKSARWILVSGGTLFGEVCEFVEHSSYADHILMAGPVKHDRISESTTFLRRLPKQLPVILTHFNGRRYDPIAYPRRGLHDLLSVGVILAQEGLNAIRTKHNFHEATAQRFHAVLSQQLSWRFVASQLLPLDSSNWPLHSVCFECMRHSDSFITMTCLVCFAVLCLFIAIFH
jgi:hypothetical protein